MTNNLFGKTLYGIQETTSRLGFPSFTAKQIAQWLYNHHAESIDEMTNLSLKNRNLLQQEFEIRKTDPSLKRSSKDGTLKYLFRFGEKDIETAVISDKDRKTICLSTQAGCRMACRFCVTGTVGFHGNLTTEEIIGQYEKIEERDAITNIVIMGMGEPLDNYEALLESLEIFTSPWGYGISPHKITLSTIGIKDKLEDFILQTNVNLAISLHNPIPEERVQLVPLESRYSILEIIDLLKKNPFPRGRKLTFEYSLLKGVNDSPRHARETAKLLQGLDAKVNLIPVNPSDRTAYEPSSENTTLTFQKILKGSDIMTTVRKSKGQDINAACGLLSATEKPD